MTIYCDNEQCGYNEDGFCWADKLHLDNNGVCMTERGKNTYISCENSVEKENKNG